jgi:hypothetical protein
MKPVATASVLNETDIDRECAPPAALRGTMACLRIPAREPMDESRQDGGRSP